MNKDIPFKQILDPHLDDRLDDYEKGLIFLICQSKSKKEILGYLKDKKCEKLVQLGYLKNNQNAL